MSNGSTRVNSWGVRIDGIHCDWLISPVDVKSGKRRFVPLLEESAHGMASILSGHGKGLLDHISREPTEHGHKGLVVRNPFVDLIGMRFVHGGQDVKVLWIGCRGTREVK